VRHEQGEGIRQRANRCGQRSDGFSIGLQVNADVFRRLHLDRRCPADNDSVRFAQTVEHDAAQEFDVVAPGVFLEDDDFEILIHQFHVAGNFEISAVVTHLGHEREAAVPGLSVHDGFEAREFASKVEEPAVPIREFAEALFEVQVEVVNNFRVESDPGHESEVASRVAWPVEAAERNADRRGFEKLLCRVIGSAGKSDFVGEDVGRAGRQRAEGNTRAGDAVYHFVDGAVAPRGQDDAAARARRGTGQFAGVVRRGCGKEVDRGTGGLEGGDGGVETCPAGPLQPSGERVIDNSYTMK
jgi:hypothetical protein